jgi:2-polyprenyl-3-methyl-5-hydroxy-6-metoxy-1,4-benzoquinol methylase
MNSKEISQFIGRRTWLRKAGYWFIFLTTLREWYIARTLRQILSAPGGAASALDAGCGMGQHSFNLARKNRLLRITAIEQDEEQVRDLADFFQRCGLDRVEVCAADITTADLGRPVDLILCCSVLEHIKEDIALLQRFHAHLQDHGRLLVYVPTSERRVLKSLARKIAAMTSQAGDQLPHGHVRYYSPQLLASTLEQSGFVVSQSEISYGPYGRLAYDLVTLVQFSRYFVLLFPFYLVLVHPFVLVLMGIDFFRTNREGNGLMMVAQKSVAPANEEKADAADAH